jgi:hypothetical protein
MVEGAQSGIFLKLNLIKKILTVLCSFCLGGISIREILFSFAIKKAGRDARPIANLNDIRSITQTQRKYGKWTKNRNIHDKNRTVGLFDSRISRYAWDTLLYRLSVDSTRQTQGVPGAARKIASATLRVGQTSKHR